VRCVRILSHQRCHAIECLRAPGYVAPSDATKNHLMRRLIKCQFIGGFKGDWEKVPSGVNQELKKELLDAEGVHFDDKGYLTDKACWWDGFEVDGVSKS